MLGSLLGLTAGTAWGTSNVLARLGLQYMQPGMGSVIAMFGRLGMLVFLVLLTNPSGLFGVSLKATLLFAVVGILNFPLALFFNYTGLKKIGASRTAPIIASSPVWSVVLAMLFLGEFPSAVAIVGALSIFAGLYLITSEGQT